MSHGAMSLLNPDNGMSACDSAFSSHPNIWYCSWITAL